MEKQDSYSPKEPDNKNKVSKEDQEIIDQVKKLPISKKEQQDIIATMEMYSGPIPHPKILAGYQALYPDAAKKIIENGLDESRHRRQLETARQKRRGHLAWASMILLVIACLIFMLGSFYLILKGHKIIGPVFGATSFLALVGSFMSNINELSGNDDISKQDQNNNKSA
ncbi:DUF2335 domain-containing protein [Limosilactobacillus fermentum]